MTSSFVTVYMKKLLGISRKPKALMSMFKYNLHLNFDLTRFEHYSFLVEYKDMPFTEKNRFLKTSDVKVQVHFVPEIFFPVVPSSVHYYDKTRCILS